MVEKKVEKYFDTHRKQHVYEMVLSFLSLFLILVIVSAGSYLYLTEKREISETLENNYKKDQLYSQLLYHAGYGGYIHNFKNIVLRNDAKLLPIIKIQQQNILTLLKDIQNLESDPEDKKKLVLIELTFKEYFSKHPILENAIERNWAPSQTDKFVKVDDSSALISMIALNAQNRERMGQAIERNAQYIESLGQLIFISLMLLLVIATISILIKHRILQLHRNSIELSHDLSFYKNFYVGALDSIQDSVIITDKDGVIEECNRHALVFFEYSKYEMCGQNVTFLMPDMEYKLNHNAYMKSSAMKTKVLNSGRDLEIVTKSGQIIPVKITVTPFNTEKGVKFIGLIHDARKEIEYINNLRESLEAHKHKANTDFLTQVLNRSGFYSSSEPLMALSLRNQKAVSVILADIDYFKQINDQFGHQSGDIVLQKIAAILKDISRKEDLVARWGGEEFVFLLYDTNKRYALEVAERLKRSVELMKIKEGDSVIDPTISLGLVTIDCVEPETILDEVIKKADEALYRAKEKGRNRIEVA